MALAVVGSIAFDTIRTPFGERERALGGSAVYAGLAASCFTDVRLVGAVGRDFGAADRQTLLGAGLDASGVQALTGETFAWSGCYGWDMNAADGEELAPGVLGEWRPHLAAAAAGSESLLLSALDPEHQIELRGQWSGAKFCAVSTLHRWIEAKPDAVIEAMRGADLVFLDDGDARLLTRQPMLLRAAREIMSWGVRAVVIKQGVYGCSLLTGEGYFALPAYPLEVAADPTGSGHAFAGAMLGYLDLIPGDRLGEGVMRRALTYGSVLASLCLESFGPERLLGLREDEINYRFDEFKAMTHFEQVTHKQKLRSRGSGRRSYAEGGERTAGTQGYQEPKQTGGTPSYGEPRQTSGTPDYDAPTPSDRPPTVR